MYRKLLLASACLITFGISEVSAKWTGPKCFVNCTRFSCKNEKKYKECAANCSPKSIVACTGSAQLQPWFLKKPIGIGGDASGLQNKLKVCMEENKRLKEELAQHGSAGEGDFQWQTNPLYEGSGDEGQIGIPQKEISPEELVKGLKPEIGRHRGKPITKQPLKEISPEELTKGMKPDFGQYKGKPITVTPDLDEQVGERGKEGGYTEKEFYDEFGGGENPNVGGKYKIGFPKEPSVSSSLQQLGKEIQKGTAKKGILKKPGTKKSGAKKKVTFVED